MISLPGSVGHQFFYKISGLSVQSDLELHGVIPADAAAPDVVVRQRQVPEHLEAPARVGPQWEITDSKFLLSLPGIGRFLAADGNIIEMQPEGEPNHALPFLLGTTWSALLLQRGKLVLHASSVSQGVSQDGGAVALCGQSGIGKSTLAAALCRAGCEFASDDISVIEPGPQSALLWPDGRCLKLFEESVASLGLDSQRGREVGSGTNKYFVDLRSRECAGPVALRAIYILDDREGPGASHIARLPPVDAAQALLHESHRPVLSRIMARQSAHVVMTAAIVAKVPVFRFTRARDLTHLNQTVEELLAHWQGLEPR